jgi:aminoglycoside phosphotransferase (APT) family kinase protein
VGGDATAEAERIIRIALAEPGARAPELDGRTARLEGGRSADLFRFRLGCGPGDLTNRDLVLRILPTKSSAAEGIIQAAVANLGYPAPEVLRSGTTDGSRSYLVMPFVHGDRLFDALGPGRALRQVPARLATLMLALHRLDPEPVRQALGGAAPAALDARRRAREEIELALSDHPSRRALRNWFDRNEPAHAADVVCHGDLHALNVVVAANGDRVLDWELAAIGEPAFDLARTKLLLHAVPMEMGRLARHLVQRLGKGIAARFEAAYRRDRPVPDDALRWFEALHAARVLVLVRAAGRSARASSVVDAWRPTVPLLADLLESRTGVRLAS